MFMTNHAQLDDEIRKYLKLVTKQNTTKEVIKRGLLLGIFTFIGTLIGFAIVLIIGFNFLSGLKEIPLLNIILEQTKLDLVIENQINKLKGNDNPTTPGTDNPEPEVTQLTYSNDQVGLKFNYPSTFNSVTNKPGSDQSSSVVQLIGAGALTSLDVYINQPPTIVGNGNQRFIPLTNGDRVVLDSYEQGAVVNGTQLVNAIYHARIVTSTSSFDFVGLSDPALPKSAREVFTALIQSASFSKP
jgi:hypothetical protein